MGDNPSIESGLLSSKRWWKRPRQSSSRSSSLPHSDSKRWSSNICEINDILNGSGSATRTVLKSCRKAVIDGFFVLLIRRSMVAIGQLRQNWSELNKADVLLLSFLWVLVDNEQGIHKSIITKEWERWKAKYTVWVAFFLNLSYAIVEFIAGGNLRFSCSCWFLSMTWEML